MLKFFIRYSWIFVAFQIVIAIFSLLFSHLWDWDLRPWSSVMLQAGIFTVLLAIAEHDSRRQDG